MTYKITLTDDQAHALLSEVEVIEKATRRVIETIQRKRSWREAERAMACVPYHRRLQVLRDFIRAPMERVQ